MATHSMKYKLLNYARKNIEEIADYTTKNWGVSQRRKYIKALYDGFELIANNPQIGKLRGELSQNLRSLVVESHVIYYSEKADHLAIVALIHKNMDPDQINWQYLL